MTSVISTYQTRGTDGMILSMEPTTPALMTEVTETYYSNYTYKTACDMESKILGWLNVIVAVVGLAGNAAVIWLLGVRMSRNAISVYILNLAVADFLYLCFTFIIALQVLISFFLGRNEFHLIYVFNFVFFYSYTAGLSFLSIISLERCLSVLCPIWYRCHRPRHASSFMCVLVWAPSFPFPFLKTFYCTIIIIDDYLNWCRLLPLLNAGYLLFLFVVLTGSSLALTVRMFCGSGRMSLTRLYVTVLLTVLVFIFCGLPYGIHYFLVYEITSDVFDYPCYLLRLFILLTTVNSSANPIIYFFVGCFRQRQRQTLKQVLQRALQDTPEDNECGAAFLRGP
ncbi:mas-related G-protein coupled receptor member A-like [Perognathus longimembris pacificus]|uniref:mas-related G-protein coupled receptor member A-like n=1 Tax=Perognathus longimembris pacificus TaxID=214514 RepID=UPI0020191CD5|nr:mas-related G-protein coupled receptor member A-like [Perognathus longimembris pacificus]